MSRCRLFEFTAGLLTIALVGALGSYAADRVVLGEYFTATW